MRTIVVTLSLFCSSALIVAPAYGQACEPLSRKGQSTGLSFNADVGKTTAVGAAAGGLLGAFVGNNSGKGDAQQGALIGAALGRAIGFGVGQVASKRRKAFQSESAYLDCEIETARTMIAEKDASLAAADAELAATEAEVDAAVAANNAGQAQAESLAALRSKIATRLEQQKAGLETAQKEIDYFDSVLKQKAGRGEDADALAVRKQSLMTEREALSVRYTELARINSSTQMAAIKLGLG